MVGLVILIVLTVFSAISLVYGVDSRDGFADSRRPAYPVGIR